MKKKRLFQLMKDIIFKIHKKGKEYITIMIVPRNHNHIQNFHTSYYFLGSVFILFLFLFSLNLIILLKKSTINQNYIAITQQYKALKAEKKEIIKEIKKMKKNLGQTETLLSEMLALTTMTKGKIDLSAIGGFSDNKDNIDSNILFGEQPSLTTLSLKEANQNLEISKQAISKLDNYLKENKKIFPYLPTSWPIKGGGGYVTSPYGWRNNPVNKQKKEFHKGLDIAFYPGSPIVATADGVVISAGRHSSYGNIVVIRHKFGFTTKYAHCRSLTVRSGQRVKRGQVIAYMGKSGRTTGYHLHYEIRIGNTAVDPWPFIIKIK